MSAENTDTMRAYFERRCLPDAAGFAEHVAARGWYFLPTQLEVLNLLSGPVGYDRPIVAAWHLKPEAALVIPYREADGEALKTDANGKAYIRLRVEPPARFKATDKKAAKYLAPPGRAPRLYLPDGVLKAAKAEGYLIITEGEIKAEYATFRGFPTVAVSGVWNWKGRTGALKVTEGPNGERETEPETKPLPDLAALPWGELNAAGVVVLVGWDSDAGGKPALIAARRKLREHLQGAYGARCQVLTIPNADNGGKNGLDDYLATKGDTELKTLIGDILASDRPAEAVDRDDMSTAQALESYGLDLKLCRYRINARGVVKLKLTGGDEGERITPRPIWPAALGRDVSTGADMLKLAWYATDGSERSQWVRQGIVGDKVALLSLADKGAPVTLKNVGNVAEWLCEAGGYVLPERRGALVASGIGWANLPERGPVFVWPGGDGVEFIGEALPSQGNAVAWADGLRQLAELGESGYLGLACVGLSAAAPLVRWVNRRRPILGIAAASSTGKTSLLTYALSVWAAPIALTIQTMNSSPKGVEEFSVRVPDLPVYLDDFQEPASENARKAGHALYFLGNGQQRTTAKKDGGANGGKSRFGVAFYASEYPIAGTMQGGADRRVVELDARPLPVNRADLGDAIKAIGNANGGAIAKSLLQAIGSRAGELAVRADMDANAMHADYPGLKGDDALTAALAGLGLELLAAATGLTLPASEVSAWLAGEAAAVRDERPDQSEEAFVVLVSIVDAADWENGRARAGGFELAYLTETIDGPAVDVNPTHEAIRRGLEPLGGEKRHRTAWAERGLILRDGASMLAQKKIEGRKLRVLRVLREVFARHSRKPVPSAAGQVGTVSRGLGTAESGVNRGF